MTFVFSVDYHESHAQGYGKFSGPSKEHGSTRRSQFQCIGWILENIDRVREFASGADIEIYGDGYDLDGLVEVGKLEEDSARRLLRAESWEERLNITWMAIDEKQKEIALKMNYQRNENFWPYFSEISKTQNPDSVFSQYQQTLRKPRDQSPKPPFYAYIYSTSGEYLASLSDVKCRAKKFARCSGSVKLHSESEPSLLV